MSNYKISKFWIIALFVTIIAAVALGLVINQITKGKNVYHLTFNEISLTKIEDLNLNNIDNINIVKEKFIDNSTSAFIYKDNEDGELKAAIKLDGKSYYIGQVSMENTPDNLFGIEDAEVFGKKAVKFYGLLGSNYAQAFYWFVDKKANSVIQIDGNTTEIDLDNDNIKEIVATTGTIPETKIYTTKDSKIYVSDVNGSTGAKSVYLQDENNKLFEVFFESNKPEKFVFSKNSFIRQ